MIQHKQLILNGFIGLPLTRQYKAKKFLNDLVDVIGMKKIIDPVAKYVWSEGNRGMTASVLIETSHIAFHIWDEESPAKIRFDLYTCGDLDVKKVIEFIDFQLAFKVPPIWLLLDRAYTKHFEILDSSGGKCLVIRDA